MRAALGFATLLPILGCSPPPATREQCVVILRRIVQIELNEQGYRDPELLRRKQAEAMGKYEPDIVACVGRPLPRGALDCVAEADDTETIAHQCLRR